MRKEDENIWMMKKLDKRESYQEFYLNLEKTINKYKDKLKKTIRGFKKEDLTGYTL